MQERLTADVVLKLFNYEILVTDEVLDQIGDRVHSAPEPPCHAGEHAPDGVAAADDAGLASKYERLRGRSEEHQ